MDYSIRKAAIGDIDGIYKVELETFAAPWTKDNFLNEYTIEYSYRIVAVQNKNIIGYAIAWSVADELHLLKIAVSNSHRRLGIARALINNVITEYGSGKKIMLLEVREKNTSARKFYKKLGFTENGIRPKYYADDNAVLIEKYL